MIAELFPHVTNLFTGIVAWFWTLLGSVGSRRIWLYTMYMLLSYRFILRPIFGGAGFAGSDKANKKRKEP